jgi:enolase
MPLRAGAEISQLCVASYKKAGHSNRRGRRGGFAPASSQQEALDVVLDGRQRQGVATYAGRPGTSTWALDDGLDELWDTRPLTCFQEIRPTDAHSRTKMAEM